MSSPTVRYSLARLGLFLGALGLLYLLGARSFLLVAAAILLSGIVSYYLLTASRVAMGQRLAGTWRSIGARIDRRARAEDAPQAVPPGPGAAPLTRSGSDPQACETPGSAGRAAQPPLAS
jgi:hypothetical protein